MMQEIFVLSPHYKLLKSVAPHTFTTTAALELEQIKKGELFVLTSTLTNTHLLINPIIKDFLTAFQTPNTLEQVMAHFAQLAQCQVDDIYDSMCDFFDDLYDQGILVEATSLNSLTPVSPVTNNNMSPSLWLSKRYQVHQKIHENGNSIIYLAQDLPNHQQVILKSLLLPKDLTSSKKQREQQRFWQEFDILQELSTHPNIYQILDRQEGQHPYVVLEYIDGWHLRKYIWEQQPDLAVRLQLIAQIFEVTGFVHQQKVIHGDIHISNFMVQKNQTIKLIDFGMANHEVPLPEEYIHEGGVYQYIPPERIHWSALEMIDGRATYVSEVFQLGIVAYFILYETMPFKAFSWHSLAQQILETTPPFPIQTPQGHFIPKPVTELIAQALAKQPKYRFQSATDLSEAWKYLVIRSS